MATGNQEVGFTQPLKYNFSLQSKSWLRDLAPLPQIVCCFMLQVMSWSNFPAYTIVLETVLGRSVKDYHETWNFNPCGIFWNANSLRSGNAQHGRLASVVYYLALIKWDSLTYTRHQSTSKWGHFANLLEWHCLFVGAINMPPSVVLAPRNLLAKRTRISVPVMMHRLQVFDKFGKSALLWGPAGHTHQTVFQLYQTSVCDKLLWKLNITGHFRMTCRTSEDR